MDIIIRFFAVLGIYGFALLGIIIVIVLFSKKT